MIRVLDVGCHDGFIDYWLHEQLPGRLSIDAIELHPDAVAAARTRNVNCVQGRAEDAPELFEPGSYDAVVAQELIEHVPDVDRFLDALERMVTRSGRIYISTPDGHFGTGGNPHHLRALRSIDLADLLRRRGELIDMNVGADGITNACYRPARRGPELAIYCGPCLQPWSPMNLYTTGLGGSETAAVRLAEALSGLGWIVTVYGEIADECCYRDVIFRRHEAFDPLARVDVLLASRIPDVFDRPTRARRRILWMHDTDCGDRLTPERAERIDDVLVLSSWHEQHVRGLYPFVEGKLRRFRNGVDGDRFRERPAGLEPAAVWPPARERRSVAYTSSPDRGLDVLLELWPDVRERVPGATLRFAYAPVYWAAAERDPVVGAHAQRIRELSDQPGVEALGALSQPQVAELMLRSAVWCAPSWHTPSGQPFYETSCIGAMEAQAAGCVVVASCWGALPETAPHALWAPPSEEAVPWRHALLERLVEALTSRQHQRKAAALGPERAEALGWEGAAELFLQLAGA